MLVIIDDNKRLWLNFCKNYMQEPSYIKETKLGLCFKELRKVKNR